MRRALSSLTETKVSQFQRIIKSRENDAVTHSSLGPVCLALQELPARKDRLAVVWYQDKRCENLQDWQDYIEYLNDFLKDQVACTRPDTVLHG